MVQDWYPLGGRGHTAELLGSPVYSANISANMQAVGAMNHFFLNHEMYVVGFVYWNMVYGQNMAFFEGF